MTPEECAAIMTYANQIDARIQLNDPTLDAWWAAMEHIGFKAAQWGIADYYGTANPNQNRGLQALLPATLRTRVLAEAERRQAKQDAQTALPFKRPTGTWRDRNPGLWDQLVAKGRDAHRADLEHRGIPLQAHQQTTAAVFTIPKPAQADLSDQKDAA